jgi:hypothetical protein
VSAFVQAILAVSFFAAVTAAGSGALALLTSVAQRVRDRRRALAPFSGDVVAVGKYLYSSVGKVHLSAYAADERVRARVDSMIDLLKELGGTEDPKSVPRRGTSNADRLVELRSFLEGELRAYASLHGMRLTRDTAAAMVRELLAGDLLPPEIGRQLMSAISTANRGLHGEKLSDAEVNQAIDQALSAIGQLGMSDTPHSWR